MSGLAILGAVYLAATVYLYNPALAGQDRYATDRGDVVLAAVAESAMILLALMCWVWLAGATRPRHRA